MVRVLSGLTQFSYGGMENPNMAFLTPTLLAGDRSLAGVVAHEISHAWTGNYVTCSSWDDFWLNEGWTVWLERKITSRLRGPKYLDFEAIGGYKDLQDAVRAMPSKFTSLVLPVGDCDPDDAYSTVAYEKGFNFLMYLESKVGTDKFEAFFQAYIKHFGSKTVSSEEFRAFFGQHFASNVDNETRDALDEVDWETWFYSPGMPPTVVEYDRSLAQASERLASQWMAVDRSGCTLPLENVHGWSSGQVVCFLDKMLSLTCSSQPLKASTLKAMKSLYSFDASKNSEILLRYCRLAIAAEDPSILPVVVRFVTSQGRMKYIRPLYKALFQSKMGKELAVQTFLVHKDSYQ
jgi:leukotriene-A4 hydrolase